jgi:hypothetical protein
MLHNPRMFKVLSEGNAQKPNPFKSLISLLIFAGVLVGLFFLFTGFIKLLYWVAPVLLVVTIVLDYRVVANYALGLLETFKTDVLWGILKLFLTLLGYPFVIGWLFVKALFYRRMTKIDRAFREQMTGQNAQAFTQKSGKGAKQDDFTDYEEIQTEELPNEKQKQKPIIIQKPNETNPFERFFDN